MAEKRSIRSLIKRLLVTVILVGSAVFAISPAPYVIEMPGPVFNALGSLGDKQIVTVVGAKTYATDGQFDVLTVQTRGAPEGKPSWIEVLLAMMNSDVKVVPMDEVYPPGSTQKQQEQETTRMMLDSQRDAIAVALKHQGYKFDTYVSVDSIRKPSPATSKLKVDDRITKVNGDPVSFYEDITSRIKASNGNPVSIEVLRDGKTKTYEITPVKDDDGTYRIGIFVGYRYDFPIDVKLYLGDVTGPSAGLMFSLSILDKMTPGSLNGSNHIAGTGTISPTGEVGAIGGIQLKMIAAKQAGAQYFLAPKSNCDEVVGHVPSGLVVHAVDTFEDALAFLSDLEQGLPVSPALNCPVK
ncbi:MAG: hypothetical protein RL009_475 [Actinomycetota bacterium]|jgi:PDZ domain-containing protein